MELLSDEGHIVEATDVLQFSDEKFTTLAPDLLIVDLDEIQTICPARCGGETLKATGFESAALAGVTTGAKAHSWLPAHVIQKPIDIDELLLTIQTIVSDESFRHRASHG